MISREQPFATLSSATAAAAAAAGIVGATGCRKKGADELVGSSLASEWALVLIGKGLRIGASSE